MTRNLLLLLVIPAALCAQTTINGSRIIKGSLDASGSTRSLPNRTGTGSPAGRDNCASPGETYFQTDATPGQNLWACTAAGTPGSWNQISGGSSSSSNAVVTGTTSPSGSCSAGAFYLRTDIQELYVCSSANVWDLASYASGNTGSRPLGCVSGELYVATDTGDLWYCSVTGSLGTWQSVTPLTNVSLNGVAQGAFNSLNLINAPGLIFNLNPTGQTLAIAPTPDTTYLLSQTAAQNGSPFLCVPSSNNSSAYACSLTPAPAALSNGMLVEFRPDVSCTGGTTTLNINGLGGKPIYSLDGASNPAANDCRVNRPTWLVYSTALNGGAGAFVMQSLANLPAQGGGGSVTSVFGQTGSVPNLSGDVTTSNSSVTTLATVNSSPGTCGDATHICQVTTNSKGLVTAQSAVGISSGGGNASITYTALGTATSNVTFTRSSNIQEWSFTLGANATSTLSGASAGDQYSFNACQGASTSYTFSWPTGFSQVPAIPTDTGVCVHFTGIWDGTNLQLSSPASTTYTPFLISGAPERGAPSSPTGTLENIWADSTRRTLVALNAAGNTHIMPRTTGGTDQLASTDLSDAANVARVNTSNAYAAGTTQDAHAAAHTLPSASGSTLPATCTVGEQFFNTAATAGQNLYFCTSTNNWTQQSGGGSGGGGTVTSVALAMPAGFGVTGSPVTGAGTLAVTANSESANTVYAGPATGSPAAPTFRALTAADLAANTAIAGITVSGTPSSGQVLTATSGAAANWQTPSGGGSVASVFGRTGTVTAQAGDYTAAQVTNAAQTNASNTFTAGTQDFHGVSHSLPVVTGTTPPSTCTQGEIFFNTGVTAGQNLYFCTATNTWTQMSGGGGSSTITENTVIPLGGMYNSGAAESGSGVVGLNGNDASSVPGVGRPSGGVSYSYYTLSNSSSQTNGLTAQWVPHQNWTGTLNVVLYNVSSQSAVTGSYSANVGVGVGCATNSTNIAGTIASIVGSLNWQLWTFNTTSGQQLVSSKAWNNLTATNCAPGLPMFIVVQRNAQSGNGDTYGNGMNLTEMALQWSHT